MRNKLLAYVLSITYSIGSYAACGKPVTYLEEGAQTPCTGFLFTLDAEKEVRLNNYELGVQSNLVRLQTKQIALIQEDNQVLSQQVNLWRTRAEDSTKKLIESENSKTWEIFLYFMAGAVVTTAITYGVNR